MTLTKAELSASLVEEFKLSKAEAKAIVDSFFEEICLALESGNEPRISGLGNFTLKNKTERPGRNPRTGEIVMVSPRRVVTFKQGQKLKKIVSKEEETN